MLSGFEVWTGMGLQLGLAGLSLNSHGFFVYSYQVRSFIKFLEAWEKNDLNEARIIQQKSIKMVNHIASLGGNYQ